MLPCPRREENYDREGTLQLIFNPFWGIAVKGYRLFANHDGDDGYVGAMIEFPEVGTYEDWDNDGECHEEFMEVRLTVAQVDQLAE